MAQFPYPHIFTAVDLGSNTIKARMWRVDESGEPVLVDQQRHLVRLGHGTFELGRITNDLLEAGISALAKIRGAAEAAGPCAIRAVGTSALREASNAAEFVQRAQAHAGVSVEVISPEREGELTARGVLRTERVEPNSHAAIIDIGGGSAEVIVADADQSGSVTSTHVTSAPLGAVRLTESFLKTDPPSRAELEQLDVQITKSLMNLSVPAPTGTVYGCGGTLVSLGTMGAMFERVDSINSTLGVPTLRVKSLAALLSELIPLRTHDRATRFHIELQRAEVIIAGAKVLLALLEAMRVSEIQLSDAGLREGLLSEHLMDCRRS